MDMTIPSKNKELNYNLYQDTNWTWDHLPFTLTPGHFPPLFDTLVAHPQCAHPTKRIHILDTPRHCHEWWVESWDLLSQWPLIPNQTNSNTCNFWPFFSLPFLDPEISKKKTTKAPKIPIFRGVLEKGWVWVEVSFLGAEIENRAELNFEVWIEWKSIWRFSSSKNTDNEWIKSYLLPFHCVAPLMPLTVF